MRAAFSALFFVAVVIVIVQATHGWALAVPGFAVLCWTAHWLRLWGNTRSVPAAIESPPPVVRRDLPVQPSAPIIPIRKEPERDAPT